jgi:hypothetical protein
MADLLALSKPRSVYLKIGGKPFLFSPHKTRNRANWALGCKV